MLLKTSGSHSFKDNRSRIFRLVLLPVAIFCLLAAAFGVLLTLEFANFKKTAVETDAVITKTVYETARGTFEPGDYPYSRDSHGAVLYVEYDVNGVKYESVLRGLGMWIYRGMGDRTGEHIQVLYNPKKPADVRSDRQAITYAVLIPGGIVASVVIFILQRRLKKSCGASINSSIKDF